MKLGEGVSEAVGATQTEGELWRECGVAHGAVCGNFSQELHAPHKPPLFMWQSRHTKPTSVPSDLQSSFDLENRNSIPSSEY